MNGYMLKKVGQLFNNPPTKIRIELFSFITKQLTNLKAFQLSSFLSSELLTAMGNCLRSNPLNTISPSTKSVQINKSQQKQTEQLDEVLRAPTVEQKSIATIEELGPDNNSLVENIILVPSKKPMSNIAKMKLEMKKKQQALSAAESESSSLFDFIMEIVQSPAQVGIDQISEKINDSSALRKSLVQKEFSGLTPVDYLLFNEKIELFGFLLSKIQLQSAPIEYTQQLATLTFKALISASKKFNKQPQMFFEFLDLIENSETLEKLFSIYLNQASPLSFLQCTNNILFMAFIYSPFSVIDQELPAAQDLFQRMQCLIERSISRDNDQKELELLTALNQLRKNHKQSQYFNNFKLPESKEELARELEDGFLSVKFCNPEFNMTRSKKQCKLSMKNSEGNFSFTLAHHIAINKRFELFTGRWEIFKSHLFQSDSSYTSAASIILRTAPESIIKELIDNIKHDQESVRQILASRDNKRANIIHLLIQNPKVKASNIEKIIGSLSPISRVVQDLLESYDVSLLTPLSFYLNKKSTHKDLEVISFLIPQILKEPSSTTPFNEWITENTYPLWEYQCLQTLSVPSFIWRLSVKLTNFYEKITAINNNILLSVLSLTSQREEVFELACKRLVYSLIPNGFEKCLLSGIPKLAEKCIEGQAVLDQQRFKVIFENSELLPQFVSDLQTLSYKYVNKFVKKLEVKQLLKKQQPTTVLDMIVTCSLREKEHQVILNYQQSQTLRELLLASLKAECVSANLLSCCTRQFVFNSSLNECFNTILKIYALKDANVLSKTNAAMEKKGLNLANLISQYDSDFSLARLQVILLKLKHPDVLSVCKFDEKPIKKSIQRDNLLSLALSKNSESLSTESVIKFSLQNLKILAIFNQMSPSDRQSFIRSFVHYSLLLSEVECAPLSNYIRVFQNTFAEIIAETGITAATQLLNSLVKSTQISLIPRILLKIKSVSENEYALLRDIIFNNQQINYVLNLQAQTSAQFYITKGESIILSLINLDLLGFKLLKLRFPQNDQKLISSLIECPSSLYANFIGDIMRSTEQNPIVTLLAVDKYFPILQKVNLNCHTRIKALIKKYFPLAVLNVNVLAVEFLLSQFDETLSLELPKNIVQQQKLSERISEKHEEFQKKRADMFKMLKGRISDQQEAVFTEFHIYKDFGSSIEAEDIKDSPSQFSENYTDLVDQIFSQNCRKQNNVSFDKNVYGKQQKESFNNNSLETIINKFLGEATSVLEKVSIDNYTYNIEAEMPDELKNVMNTFCTLQRSSSVFGNNIGLQESLLKTCKASLVLDCESFLIQIKATLCEIFRFGSKSLINRFIDEYLIWIFVEKCKRCKQNEEVKLPCLDSFLHLSIEAAYIGRNEEATLRLLTISYLVVNEQIQKSRLTKEIRVQIDEMHKGNLGRIVKSYEERNIVPLGRWITAHQVNDLLETLVSYEEQSKKHTSYHEVLFLRTPLLLNDILLESASQGDVENVRNILKKFPHRISAEVLFEAASNSAAKMIVNLSSTDFKSDNKVLKKLIKQMGSIMTASVIKAQVKKQGPSEHTRVNDFLEIIKLITAELTQLQSLNKLIPIEESIALYFANVMKSALIVEFPSSIQLLRLFLASGTPIIRKIGLLITREVIKFGPLNTVTTWSKAQFGEFLALTSSIYLTTNNISSVWLEPPTDSYLQLGDFIHLSSRDPEMNQIYLQLLLNQKGMKDKYPESANDTLKYIVMTAISRCSGSKVFLLNAVKSLSVDVTSTTKLLSQNMWNKITHTPVNFSNYIDQIDRKHEVNVNKAANVVEYLMKHLSKEELDHSLEIGLLSLSTLCPLPAAVKGRRDFLQITDDITEVSLARLFILTGNQRLFLNHIDGVIKINCGLSQCIRDCFVSGNITIFKELMEKVGDQSQQRQFIFEEKLLFESVASFLSCQKIYEFIIDSLCLEYPSTYDIISPQNLFDDGNQSFLKNLVVLQLEQVLIKILTIIIKHPKHNQARLDNYLNQWMLEGTEPQSFIGLLRDCCFYETLCFLFENSLLVSFDRSEKSLSSQKILKFEHDFLSQKKLISSHSSSQLFTNLFNVYAMIRSELMLTMTSKSEIQQLESVIFSSFSQELKIWQESLESLLKSFQQKDFVQGLFVLIEIFRHIDITYFLSSSTKQSIQRAEIFNIYILTRTVLKQVDFFKFISQLSLTTACPTQKFIDKISKNKVLESLINIKESLSSIIYFEEIILSEIEKSDIIKQVVQYGYNQKNLIRLVGEHHLELLLEDDEIINNIVLQDSSLAAFLIEKYSKKEELLEKFRKQIISNNEPDEERPRISVNEEDSPFNKVLRSIIYYFDTQTQEINIKQVYAQVFQSIPLRTKQGISFQYHIFITQAVTTLKKCPKISHQDNISSEILEDLAVNDIYSTLEEAGKGIYRNPEIMFNQFFNDLAMLVGQSKDDEKYTIAFKTLFSMFQAIYSLRIIQSEMEKNIKIHLVKGNAQPKIIEVNIDQIVIQIEYKIETDQIQLVVDRLQDVEEVVETAYFEEKYLWLIQSQITELCDNQYVIIDKKELGEVKLNFNFETIAGLPLEDKQIVLHQVNFIPIAQPLKKSHKLEIINNQSIINLQTYSSYNSNQYFGLDSLFSDIAKYLEILNVKKEKILGRQGLNNSTSILSLQE